MTISVRQRIGWLSLCIALAGCGVTEPYVFKADEFDRDSATFNKEPADLAEVSVCFNAMTSRAEERAAIADAACEKFGKRAEAKGTGFGNCPMLTPQEARFDCARR